MKSKKTVASGILENVSGLMDYELLVSRPGIKEADSDFMWASSFRAPIGINFVGGEGSLNLFLPEGSEDDKDKKIFLTRVGAKFQDGMWQVRKSLKEVHGEYGFALRNGLSNFRSLVLDHSYIQRGRYYAHFTFNVNDLDELSEGLMSFAEIIEGYRVEYLRKLHDPANVFDDIDERGDISMVTVEITQSSGPKANEFSEDMVYFVMSNFLDDGIKTIGKVRNNKVPKILAHSGLTDISHGVKYFKSGNELIIDLIQRIALDYIVLYGLYGAAGENYLHLMLPIPSQQTSSLLRAVRKLAGESSEWKIKLIEISSYSDLP